MSLADPSPTSPHAYEREISGSGDTSLSVVAARIAAGARVLDLGCGNGAIGRFLAQRDGRRAPIDGLTINQAEAEQARAHYRRVEVADLEQADLTQIFERGAYDLIVCADVLEHVRQAPRVLRACRELLAPGGAALLSVPNAGYCGLIAELMAGEFRYREEGLLDATHVHFFTRASLLRLLAENGWRAARFDTFALALPDSEFLVPFDALPPAVARYLLALPDALAYQFIVTAQPDTAAAALPAAETGPQPARAALFSAELFLGADGRYEQAHKLTARGEIGCERQTLRFDLPAAPAARLSGLKLDPADRPGFLRLHGLTLTGSAGQTLWRWTPDDVATLAGAPHHDLILAPPVFESGGLALLLYGDDPSIELPIAPQALAQAAGGALTVELGWPMSADYLALASMVRMRIGQAERERAQKQEALHRQSLSSIQEQNAQLRRERLELTARARNLSRERDEARALVRAIETTKMFRFTRPIVHAKLWIERFLGRKAPGQTDGRAAPAPQPLTPPAAPVDVIVPVYRGLQDTRRCVESVLRAACQTPWRLILINDASPEPELAGWLRQTAAAEPRITLLENGENLGFVGTVNRGMALAPANDVLLLNSDTEVADGWLDRLRAAAYSDRKIATVTPFSNNATICSYPRFGQDNELPEGWDTARLDALFARVNAGQAVDVPTGVGFCMYIRRAALETLGLFDAEHFGKGYGEENDFCVRAQMAGWRNLHALDTFVRHLGGVSFGEAKKPRELAAQEMLRRLHPQYESNVLRFVQADPARLARHAVDAARLFERLHGGRPVILAVLHNRLGGTERHVLELARLLQDRACFLVLRPEPGRYVSLRLASESEGFELRFALDPVKRDLPSETSARDEYGDDFAALLTALRAFGVCHIHYHHRVGHMLAILDLPRRLGVSYDFTVHDYYAICPQINLTDSSQGYCGEQGQAQCDACLAKTPAPGHIGIAQWRRENAGFLDQVRFIITPSRDVLARMLRYVPAAPFRLVPHTDIDLQTRLPEPRPPQLKGDRPLKVAILGALSVAKGANVVADVTVMAKTMGAPVEFHLVGYSYRPLKTQPHAYLTVHGPYEDADLPQLLNWLQPDVVWFPAQWPETYCYTLSACLQDGWPVAASAIGAFSERLAGRRWTWLQPWNTPAAVWLDFFTDIRERYFRSGQSPAPPMPVLPELPASALPDMSSRDWYAGPYLAELPQADPPLGLTPELRDLMAAHLASNQDGGITQSARALTLQALTRARAFPLLTGIVRAIGPHRQKRVKNWLLK